MTSYAEVVVTLPVEGRFHYEVPPHLEGALEIGHRVLVPFGRRKVTGFVLALTHEVPAGLLDKVRPIAERLDREPALERDLLQLATFAADYYLATVGEVLHLALPPGYTAASKVRWTITSAGRHFLESGRDRLPNGAFLSTSMRRLLEASVKRAVVAKDAPAKAASDLESLGLVAKKVAIGARRVGGELTVVARTVGPDQAEPHLLRSPIRRAVYEALGSGERSVDELAAEIGRRQLSEALKRLEAEGIVAKKRVALSAVGRPHAPLEGPIISENAVPPALTEAQSRALRTIVDRFDAGQGGAFLLHGVTASGKTEVYLRAIAHALEKEKGAVVLVPEIALTPQLENRFRARFGDRVAVLHSALPDAERRARWRRLSSGEARIALGPRSAIWAPVQRLGIIVVDEEHDPSFKQSSDVRYNGRDLALVRAHQAKAIAILGSATPSLEAMHLVEQQRVARIRLAERVEGRPMPAVEVVDLVEERRAVKGAMRLLSRLLSDRLREVVSKKEQAILFLNRRGFNTVVYCDECTSPRRCPSCDVSLTFHKGSNTLACHYCGHVEPFESPCRSCKSLAMQPFGAGTERVVDAVVEAVPDARVLRLDRDVTERAGELDRTLEAFRSGRADVLVGTQMVAKGHDFPRVTLVGIVLADASLAFPDFRAAERTFQLLVQVSGRAGRADAPGRVVIQTLQRDHYALQAALHHDTERFLAVESEERRRAGYPPYARMALVRIESKDKGAVERAAADVRRALERNADGIKIRGPVPAPIARIRERHRRMLMVLSPTPARLNGVLRRAKIELKKKIPRRVDLIFDVDPVDLL
jgi:primosomal protein N' (replication factor Y) (superfamily II helicase)